MDTMVSGVDGAAIRSNVIKNVADATPFDWQEYASTFGFAVIKPSKDRCKMELPSGETIEVLNKERAMVMARIAGKT